MTGYVICKTSKIQRSIIVEALFLCDNGEEISSKFRCDGKTDCRHSEDEKECYCLLEGNSMKSPKSCAKSVDYTCGFLMMQLKEGGCKSYIRSSRRIRATNSERRVAIDGESCNKPGEQSIITECLPCGAQETQYYASNEHCVYNLATDGKITGCLNGAHLRRCENFACQQMYKCKGTISFVLLLICESFIFFIF